MLTWTEKSFHIIEDARMNIEFPITDGNTMFAIKTIDLNEKKYTKYICMYQLETMQNN